jgi:hypothetical protein
MIARDSGSWQQQLQNAVKGLNFGDPNQAVQDQLGDIQRQVSYAQNAGKDPAQFVQAAIAELQKRGAPGSQTNTPGAPADQTPANLQAVNTAYNGTGTVTTGTSPDLNAFMTYLQGRQTAADANQTQMRQMLMSRLGDLSQPVSATDPQIAPILAGQQIGTQRAAEKQQSQLAARLASMGLAHSGAADTGQFGITQAQGEQNAQNTGNVLNSQLSQRQAQLNQLLSLAVQSGDTQTAQTIQQQLQALQQQTQQNQFGQSLGYNYDALGANVGLQQAGLNQSALLQLLNALGL